MICILDLNELSLSKEKIMANEKILAKGLFATNRHSSAPAFVKGKLSIKVSEFKQFLDENENDAGYVNIDLLENIKDSSKWNGFLNTWKKVDDGQPTEQDVPAKKEPIEPQTDLPF